MGLYASSPPGSDSKPFFVPDFLCSTHALMVVRQMVENHMRATEADVAAQTLAGTISIDEARWCAAFIERCARWLDDHPGPPGE